MVIKCYVELVTGCFNHFLHSVFSVASPLLPSLSSVQLSVLGPVKPYFVVNTEIVIIGVCAWCLMTRVKIWFMWEVDEVVCWLVYGLLADLT